MYTTQNVMADTHDYIDNKNNTNHHSIPDDERLHLLDADSAYCDVDQVLYKMKAMKQASRLQSTVHYI